MIDFKIYCIRKYVYVVHIIELKKLTRVLLKNRATSWVRSKFPHTPQITTQQLEDKLGSCPSSIIVIDCRSSGENRVSQIRGAKHLNFNAEEDVINEFLVENGVESGRIITIDHECPVSVLFNSNDSDLRHERCMLLLNRVSLFHTGEQDQRHRRWQCFKP